MTSRTSRWIQKPPAMVVFSFLAAILLGTCLLRLPWATTGKGISFVDALFTSTSACCVTGLAVVDTGTVFTKFGQMTLVGLIQVGGLGIMTISTFFVLLTGQRIGMREQIVLKETLGPERILKMGRLLVSIMAVTFAVEGLGWIVLFLGFRGHGIQSGPAAYSALFHSVSAFCNAGFSIYPDNLCSFKGSIPISMGVTVLLFLGGLGFVVILNLMDQRPWRKDRTRRGRLTLQSKITLTCSLALGAIGTLLIALLEWHHTMNGLTLKEKVLCAIFHSFSPRTAGFNTLPVGEMRSSTLFLTLFLMFIGASPGSTGGGIKTCTFIVLLGVCRAIILGDEEIVLFNRTIPNQVIRQAICVTVISTFVVLFFTTLCLCSEAALKEMTLERVLFEVISAFGTVGLSTGITPQLSVLSKVLISLTMFIGRTGPLTLALMVSASDPARRAIRYPEEGIMVG